MFEEKDIIQLFLYHSGPLKSLVLDILHRTGEKMQSTGALGCVHEKYSNSLSFLSSAILFPALRD
jgi:hypothetical protein